MTLDPEKTVDTLSTGTAQAILAVMCVGLFIVCVFLYRRVQQLNDARVDDGRAERERARADMLVMHEALSESTTSMQKLTDVVMAVVSKGSS